MLTNRIMLFLFLGFLIGSLCGAYEPLVLVSPHEKENGAFGSGILGVPDMDGDGSGDIFVGESGGGENSEGKVYLFSGKTGDLIREFDSPTSKTNGEFSYPVLLYDINGDEIRDFALSGIKEGDLSDGRVHVYSGKTCELIYTIQSPNQEEDGLFGGQAVSGIEDLNGDGISDIIVGAYSELGPIGRVYVFSGKDGKEVIHTLNSPFPSPASELHFGIRVLGMSDLNGDSVSDILVSSLSSVYAHNAGMVYAFSGSTGELLYHIPPEYRVENAFFIQIAAIPDLDDDNTSDILVGAPGMDNYSGYAFFFSGADGKKLAYQPDYYEHRDEYYDKYCSNYGTVSTFPDMTGDGKWDFTVSAIYPNFDYSFFPYTDMVYIYSGVPKELQYYIYGHSHDYIAYPDVKILISPHQECERFFGKSSGLPDANGDGLTDLVVSDFLEDSPDGKKWVGRVYIYYTEPDLWVKSSGQTDFGRCRIDEPPSSPNEIILHNYSEGGFVGRLDFTGKGIEITGADAAHFQFAPPPSIEPIPYYEQISVLIKFVPLSFGLKQANLRITTNDPDQPEKNVTITGMCSTIWIEPDSLDFGEYDPTRNPPPSQEISITNDAPDPLGFTGAGIEITGPDAGDFSFAMESGFFPLGEKETRIIKVQFHPTRPGEKSALLNIYTTDPYEPNHQIPLSGHCLYIPEKAIYVSGGTDGFMLVYPESGDREFVSLENRLSHLGGTRIENENSLLGYMW